MFYCEEEFLDYPFSYARFCKACHYISVLYFPSHSLDDRR